MTGDRARLVELVRKLMVGRYSSEEEAARDMAELEAGVLHPRVSDLIFYWQSEFDHEPTAEEVVDRALSYRAIEL